jgi:DNA-directed RNA polymerase subunit RPC12/RpoP
MKVGLANGSIEFTHGIEGPHHDLYHYEEVEYRRGALRVELHLGLGDWIRVNGAPVEEGTPLKIFEDLVGASLQHLETWCQRALSRCRCGSRRIEPQKGYPGETLYLCADCGAVIRGSFDVSAVM